ncbi:hypothetical protein A33Q_1265 [Indibacter alkaliphilus LW1]|uniref:Uncharacterized protein n=1 Tax=Indibacter alkaliphilus (strain CCUG 57479 / KCTC 22604 / LW1) TaxID=1189612 RepID=S2E2C6_INDAL|nr:hypothetical protein A33Q_1265 [Indibacter alkaliphilus LW1]
MTLKEKHEANFYFHHELCYTQSKNPERSIIQRFGQKSFQFIEHLN